MECLFAKACLGAPRPSHAISEQCPLRLVDAPPTNGSGNMGNLRQARGQPLCLREQHSLPLIFKRTGTRRPTTGPTSSFMLSPDRPDPAGNQENQGTEAQSSVSGPALEEPALVCRAVLAAHCSPVANGKIWHPQPKLWALHLWPLDGSLRTFPREC